jgi:hypothetical protein
MTLQVAGDRRSKIAKFAEIILSLTRNQEHIVVDLYLPDNCNRF